MVAVSETRLVEASAPTRFQPGQSGNPGGRTKAQREVQEALKNDGASARKKLLELMACGDLKVELQAAKTILEYAIGKAPDAPEDTAKREDSIAALLVALATNVTPTK